MFSLILNIQNSVHIFSIKLTDDLEFGTTILLATGLCIIGIDGSGTVDQLRTQLRGIVDQTANLVELGREVRDDEIVINPDYAYPAYGVPSNETNEAIRLAARTEAMITDPVYEGKSMLPHSGDESWYRCQVLPRTAYAVQGQALRE